MSSLKCFLALLAGASSALSGAVIVGGGSSRGYGNVGGGGGGYGNIDGGGRGYGNVGDGGGYGNNFGLPGAAVGGGGGGYGNNYEQPAVSVGGGGGYGNNNNNNYERPAASVEYGGGGGGQIACGTPGNCYANGCEAAFLSAWNVTGVCAGGRYAGCACAKCGDVNGPCGASGCAGVGGMCQAGPYQGCECGGGPPGVQHH